MVNGNQYVTNYVPMEKQPELQMRIMCDTEFHGIDENGSRDFNLGEVFNCRISKDQVFATALHVDSFDGGPNSSVEFEVAGQAVEMARTPYVDIHVQQLYQRADDKKTWVNGETSDHIWVADLPADAVVPGLHTIKVTATDEYGRDHVGYKVLEVASFSSHESTSNALSFGLQTQSETESAAPICTPEQLEHIETYGCDEEENLCEVCGQQI